jgi:hypothetical protein
LEVCEEDAGEHGSNQEEERAFIRMIMRRTDEGTVNDKTVIGGVICVASGFI